MHAMEVDELTLGEFELFLVRVLVPMALRLRCNSLRSRASSVGVDT